MYNCREKSATSFRKWFRKTVTKPWPFFGSKNATVWVYALSKTNFRSTVFWSQNRCWKMEPQSRFWAHRGVRLAGDPRLRSWAACTLSSAHVSSHVALSNTNMGRPRACTLYEDFTTHLGGEGGGPALTNLQAWSCKRAADAHLRN